MEPGIIENKDLRKTSFTLDNSDVEINKVSNNSSIQSANALFKFMKELDFLKMILSKMAILPRYYEEDISYLKIPNRDKIAFPMACFCDIHLNRLDPHIKKYGSYGIGLKKSWGIDRGLQPIQYVNPNSDVNNQFGMLFTHSDRMDDEKRAEIKAYNDYLLTQLLFMKPITGSMAVENRYEDRNFTDEREWRFVPNFNGVDTDLPHVIGKKENLNQTSYNSHSKGIAYRPEFWLNLHIDDIKYLIINDENDRDDLIDFLLTEDMFKDKKEAFNLISKIHVFNNLQEDW